MLRTGRQRSAALHRVLEHGRRARRRAVGAGGCFVPKTRVVAIRQCAHRHRLTRHVIGHGKVHMTQLLQELERTDLSIQMTERFLTGHADRYQLSGSRSNQGQVVQVLRLERQGVVIFKKYSGILSCLLQDRGMLAGPLRYDRVARWLIQISKALQLPQNAPYRCIDRRLENLAAPERGVQTDRRRRQTHGRWFCGMRRLFRQGVVGRRRHRHLRDGVEWRSTGCGIEIGEEVVAEPIARHFQVQTAVEVERVVHRPPIRSDESLEVQLFPEQSLQRCGVTA